MFIAYMCAQSWSMVLVQNQWRKKARSNSNDLISWESLPIAIPDKASYKEIHVKRSQLWIWGTRLDQPLFFKVPDPSKQKKPCREQSLQSLNHEICTPSEWMKMIQDDCLMLDVTGTCAKGSLKQLILIPYIITLPGCQPPGEPPNLLGGFNSVSTHLKILVQMGIFPK